MGAKIQRQKHEESDECTAEQDERRTTDDQRHEKQPAIGSTNREGPIHRGVDRLQPWHLGHGLKETARP
jgi:hypothetical protein